MTSAKTYSSSVNRVLIQVDQSNSSVQLSDGHKLLIDTTYEKEAHAAQSGIVVAVPSHLHYDTTRGAHVGSLEYDADMELRVGDKVFFHHLLIENCVEQNQVIIDGDDILVSGSYDMIYCAERGDEVVMINGWILVEPLNDEIVTPLLLPDSVVNKRSMKAGRVAYVGNPIRQYRDFPLFDDSSVTVVPGQEIVFTPFSDRPLEYDIHSSIGEKKKYFRMQRIDVVGEIIG